MEWSEETTLRFIECYRSHPSLWDKKHSDYKNKLKRHDALVELASDFSLEKSEVERKIKNLQSYFARERKREVEGKRTGSGAEEPYVSTWFAYESLMFLVDKIKPRNTVANIEAPRNESNNGDDPPTEETDTEHHTSTSRRSSSSTEESQPGPSDGFKSPTPPTAKQAKRAFKRGSDNSTVPVIDEALNLMKSIQSRRADMRDEYSLFGEQVAIKIRKIPSARARFEVQNIINKALFDAEMGIYDNPYTAQACQLPMTNPIQFYSNPNPGLPHNQNSYFHPLTQPTNFNWGNPNLARPPSHATSPSPSSSYSHSPTPSSGYSDCFFENFSSPTPQQVSKTPDQQQEIMNN